MLFNVNTAEGERRGPKIRREDRGDQLSPREQRHCMEEDRHYKNIPKVPWPDTCKPAHGGRQKLSGGERSTTGPVQSLKPNHRPPAGAPVGLVQVIARTLLSRQCRDEQTRAERCG